MTDQPSLFDFAETVDVGPSLTPVREVRPLVPVIDSPGVLAEWIEMKSRAAGINWLGALFIEPSGDHTDLEVSFKGGVRVGKEVCGVPRTLPGTLPRNIAVVGVAGEHGFLARSAVRGDGRPLHRSQEECYAALGSWGFRTPERYRLCFSPEEVKRTALTWEAAGSGVLVRINDLALAYEIGLGEGSEPSVIFAPAL